MPQVEGWRLESGEQCFPPMTASGPGASVLACAPVPGSAFSEGSAGLGGKTAPGHVPAVGPGQVASSPDTRILPCGRVVLRINSKW